MLALAYCKISHNIMNVVTAPRAEIETELRFAGFLVLDCPLKPQCKRLTKSLIDSSHRLVVITGDNALTACAVAAKVGIMRKPSSAQLILEKSLEWTNVATGRKHSDFSASKDAIDQLATTHDLCVTGAALSNISDAVLDNLPT